MTSPRTTHAWALFQSIAPDSYFEELIRQHGLRFRKRVYWLGAVIWMMLLQRLHGDAGLAEAVLWAPARRGRRGKAISLATGGYCQARQRVPTLVAKQVSDTVFESLRQQMVGPGSRPVFVVDGTTLRLEHSQDLVQAFPPGQNQHGENHWPVLLMVAFHDAHTGLAVRPSWGPMYGEHAVSEQQLAEQGLERLPAGAVVIGDGNFGIFAFAYAVHRSQRPVLVRLTRSRASKILGRTPNRNVHRKVRWEPSSYERQAHPELPEHAHLEGWVLVRDHPQRPQEKLYLFTTLPLRPRPLLALYKLRWNIETDLRSLKRTVNLHQVRSRSRALVENELVLAVTAYNLVRTVIFQAARLSGATPRQFSFARVQAAVRAALPELEQARTSLQREQRMLALVELATQLKLPQRKRKRRSYPRHVWQRGESFPIRRVHPRQEPS